MRCSRPDRARRHPRDGVPRPRCLLGPEPGDRHGRRKGPLFGALIPSMPNAGDQAFSRLHSVERGTLAQIVGRDPERDPIGAPVSLRTRLTAALHTRRRPRPGSCSRHPRAGRSASGPGRRAEVPCACAALSGVSNSAFRTALWETKTGARTAVSDSLISGPRTLRSSAAKPSSVLVSPPARNEPACGIRLKAMRLGSSLASVGSPTKTARVWPKSSSIASLPASDTAAEQSRSGGSGSLPRAAASARRRSARQPGRQWRRSASCRSVPVRRRSPPARSAAPPDRAGTRRDIDHDRARIGDPRGEAARRVRTGRAKHDLHGRKVETLGGLGLQRLNAEGDLRTQRRARCQRMDRLEARSASVLRISPPARPVPMTATGTLTLRAHHARRGRRRPSAAVETLVIPSCMMSPVRRPRSRTPDTAASKPRIRLAPRL